MEGLHLHPAPAAGAMEHVPLPEPLKPLKALLDPYVQAKIRQFAGAFSRRVGLNATQQQLEGLVQETLAGLTAQEQLVASSRSLRLVLRHDCQSTGCGELGCMLCQYNPSRLCKRNLKNKYLIDDHLKAKCSAPLRVELVDDTGNCVPEGLPADVKLEVHVLNGERYKEICPDNTLLTHPQLKSCIIAHHQKALLRREGAPEDQLRCFLQLERGQAPLSDLQVTTSSEALLAGKAPTFRLLVWAVDGQGEPVANVTYVVSENFVVATKRVKHAIKSDIPSVADHVSKLVHIGKATVDKLTDLRRSAQEEGFEITLPDELNHIEKVGQFRELVELAEMNSDVKSKVRHLLKLSPEKWEEVSSHALNAVVPDFRRRVWWCEPLQSGLLFQCKNGAVAMDHPTALVKLGVGGAEGKQQEIPVQQLDPTLFNLLPKLKQQAVQSWYAAGHPGWAIYWKDGQQGGDPQGPGSMGGAAFTSGGGAPPPFLAQAVAPSPPPQGLPPLAGPQAIMGPPQPQQAAGAAARAQSPFATLNHQGAGPGGGMAAMEGVQTGKRTSNSGNVSNGGNKAAKPSPFAAVPYMQGISSAFPAWQQDGRQQAGAAPPGAPDARADSNIVVAINPNAVNAAAMHSPQHGANGVASSPGQQQQAGPSQSPPSGAQQQQGGQHQGGQQPQQQGQGGNTIMEIPSLDMMNTAELGQLGNLPSSLWNIPSAILADAGRSQELIPGLSNLPVSSGHILEQLAGNKEAAAAALAAMAAAHGHAGPSGQGAAAAAGGATGAGDGAGGSGSGLNAEQIARLTSGMLGPGGNGLGQGGDRQLSLKFSMSLDLQPYGSDNNSLDFEKMAQHAANAAAAAGRQQQ